MELSTYGFALRMLRKGKKVAREGWNGKGMFVFLIAGYGSGWEFITDIEGIEDYELLPFICMKTADNKLVPWFASQTDMLAEDWAIVE